MLRFYRQQEPTIGDPVVVQITDIQDSIIHCKLMEYGGLDGIICKADVSKKLTKIYNSLTLGKLIPVICTSINIKEDNKLSVDLNYNITDTALIKNIMSQYELILKICNIIKWYTTYDINIINDNYYNAMSILENTIYKLTKEEIIDIFYTNVQSLHVSIQDWNITKDFKDTLLNKFPLPKKEISISFTLSNVNSYGVKIIKNNLENIKQDILTYDKCAIVKISLISSPIYKLNIESSTLTTFNYDDYLNIINNIVNSFSVLS